MKKIRVAFIGLVASFVTYACAYATGVTVGSGATITLSGSPTITVVDLTNSGTLSAGAGTINLSGNWTNSSTFTAGTSTVNFTAGSGTQTLTSGGTGSGKLFYHLTHSGAGTLTLGTNAIDIDGNFNNSAGIFNANGLAMSAAGTWTNGASATFTPGGNTVTLDGINQSIIGSTTFYNFNKVESADNSTDEILTFDHTGTQTIEGLFTLDGRDSEDRINLVSDSPSSYWGLICEGTFAIDNVDVTDSDASDGETVFMTDPSNCVDGGHNLNWGFGLPTGISTPITDVYVGERLTLRIQIDNDATAAANNLTYKLQWENYTDAPDTWTDVGADTQISYSLGLAGVNGAATATNHCGTGQGKTWVNGTWHEGTNSTNKYTLEPSIFLERSSSS